jgi:hypothetical protein
VTVSWTIKSARYLVMVFVESTTNTIVAPTRTLLQVQIDAEAVPPGLKFAVVPAL